VEPQRAAIEHSDLRLLAAALVAVNRVSAPASSPRARPVEEAPRPGIVEQPKGVLGGLPRTHRPAQGHHPPE
jgi:hypothetical protein